MLAKITSAIPLTDKRVSLRFATGEEFVLDLAPMIAKGGVFGPLADEEMFRKVRIGGRGRFLAWPAEVELCADSLLATVARAKAS